MPAPFAGVNVLDFSWVIAGPVITRHLSMYGANVVKIESHAKLDPARMTNFVGKPGKNKSLAFALANVSKKSVTIDMKSPKGVDLVKGLVAWADVVIENFSPRAMKSWGLDYESLTKIKPGIIMLSASMQGQNGPNAMAFGTGPHLQGLVGLMDTTGWPDREPVGPGFAYTDMIGPWYAIAALAASLAHRRKTGKGQYIDLSQYETTLQFFAPALMDCAVNGRVQSRIGNSSPRAAPHGAYRCKGDDRWCAIAVETDEEWRFFCAVAGHPEWADSPRYKTTALRLQHAAELDGLVESWTAALPADEVMSRLQRAGVPAGVVADAKDINEDPQLKHRGHFAPVQHPEIGPYLCELPSFRISTAEPILVGAPRIGEHTKPVLQEILRLSDDEIATLETEGVLH
jgi:benzylsuccinate CoA-transferase BbsF subunit